MGAESLALQQPQAKPPLAMLQTPLLSPFQLAHCLYSPAIMALGCKGLMQLPQHSETQVRPGTAAPTGFLACALLYDSLPRGSSSQKGQQWWGRGRVLASCSRKKRIPL